MSRKAEVHALRDRLRNEIARRVRAEREAGEAAVARKAMKVERDSARKRLADQDAGVAKLISDLQIQGAVLSGGRSGR